MKRCFIAPLSLALLAALMCAAPAWSQDTSVDDAPPPPTQDAADDNPANSRDNQDRPQDDATAAERQADPNRDTPEADDETTDSQTGDVERTDSQADDTNRRRQDQRSADPNDRQDDEYRRDANRDYGNADDRQDRDSQDEARDQAATERGRRDRGRAQADAQAEINVQSTDDLGIQVQEEDEGLSVTNIERNSVLMQSGFRSGDVIVSIQDRPVRTSRDFVRWFRGIDRQGNVPVIVLRDGQRQTIYLDGADIWQWYDRGDDAWPRDSRGQLPYLGVVFDDRYPQLAMVEVVRRRTAADRAGLRPGDVIQRINGQRVYGLRHASQLVSELRPGEEIELEYSRRTTARANATLGSRPDNRQTAFNEGNDGFYSEDSDYSEAYDMPRDDGEVRTTYEYRDFDDDRGIRERDGLLRRGAARPFRNP